MNLEKRDELFEKFDSSLSRDLKDATQWLFAVNNDDEWMVFLAALGKYRRLLENLQVSGELEISLKKFVGTVDIYLQKHTKIHSIEDFVLDIVEQLKFIVNMLRVGGNYETTMGKIISMINNLESKVQK